MSRQSTRQVGVFPHRLRVIRQRNEITQEQLAPRVPVTMRTIQRWEHGLSEPTASQLAALARELGTTTDDFFLDDEVA